MINIIFSHNHKVKKDKLGKSLKKHLAYPQNLKKSNKKTH